MRVYHSSLASQIRTVKLNSRSPRKRHLKYLKRPHRNTRPYLGGRGKPFSLYTFELIGRWAHFWGRLS